MTSRFNRLPPRPEYLEAVLDTLAGIDQIGLKDVAQLSKLSQTQAACALDALVADGTVEIRRQNQHPKVLYSLPDVSAS